MSFVGVAIGTAVGVGTTALAGRASRKTSKKQGELLGNLEYYEDPNYTETQDFLKKYGINLLEGDIPEYYKAIGETGGQELQDIINMTNRDITQGAQEGLAKTGRLRGGSLAASIAQPVADNSAKLRYSDFERMLKGKEYLMGQGIGITEGVRGAAQEEGGARNEFNVAKTGAQIALEGQKGEQKAKEIGAYGAELTNLIQTPGLFGEGGIFSKKTTPTDGVTLRNQTRGLSTVGAIDDDELSKLFADLKSGRG